MGLPEGIVDGPMLEREGELAAIETAVVAAREGEGAVVVIEGAAGIGKTRLLTGARATAAAAGLDALVARGSDLEREFQWGVVRQLFEPRLRACTDAERERLLAGSAGLAAGVVSARGRRDATEAAAADRGPGALLHGLHWLSANLAERRPVLLAVDDAHWSDLPSLRFFAYLASRVEGLALALIVATRPGEAEPAGEDLLSRLAGEPRAAVLRPAPLSGDAVTGYLATRFRERPDARFASACRIATEGNPFLLAELVRAAGELGLAPDAEAADAVADLGPRSVARAIIRRVRALGTDAVGLAHAVSVLGSDAELRRVAALAGLELGRAGALADRLTTAEVLAEKRPLEFIHPLVRAALYRDLPAAERAALHAAAARLLGAEGAARDRIAGHLLATEPSGDPATVEVLRTAAAEAIANGAPPAAIAYLERAVAEPPAADQLATVLYELGRAEAADARSERFEEHLRRAAQLSATPAQRARVELDLARATTYAGNWVAGGRIASEALTALGDSDPTLTAALEAELIPLAFNEYELIPAARPRLRQRFHQLQAGELEAPDLLGALALALAAERPPAAPGARLAARAAASKPPEPNSLVPGCIGNALLFGGDLGGSARYYGELAAEARRRGLKFWAAYAASFRARPLLELGECRSAEEEARLGVELLDDVVEQPGPHTGSYFAAHLAYALLERGALDEAETLLATRELPEGAVPGYPAALLLVARSRLRLAQGRPEEAMADTRAAERSVRVYRNPACLSWQSDLALALAALGRGAEAIELAGEEVSRARAFEVPHAISRALRAEARCRGDHEEAVPLLEQAVAAVDGTAARLELAHATVELGSALRRDGRRRAAVDRLRAGFHLAHRCGATALAERARAELVAAGARPRRAPISGVDALTAAERRVAELAAKGMTNNEIAQALFVTARTVEGHLTHGYRKLEISSRRQLADALRSAAEDPDNASRSP